MSDLISRQAVMDATKTVMKDTLDSLPTRLEDGEEVYDVRTSELDFILNINKALQNAIKSLPSETHEIRTETHGVCSDTISRQAAIDEAKEWIDAVYFEENDKRERKAIECFIGSLKNIPSAQPEIVRCKDCKFGVYEKGRGIYHIRCEILEFLFQDDDFCSYGERKEEE